MLARGVGEAQARSGEALKLLLAETRVFEERKRQTSKRLKGRNTYLGERCDGEEVVSQSLPEKVVYRFVEWC